MLSPLMIFADGSFNQKGQEGAWAFVVFENEVQIHADRGSSAAGSNNSLEVLAVLKAVDWLRSQAVCRTAKVVTDSMHVVEGCERWRAIWRGNGWRRIRPNSRIRNKKIPDVDLWRRLDGLLLSNGAVQIEWCKGHAGVVGNELADLLARAS